MGSIVNSRIMSNGFNLSDRAIRFSEWLLNSNTVVQPLDFWLAMQAIPCTAFYQCPVVSHYAQPSSTLCYSHLLRFAISLTSLSCSFPDPYWNRLFSPYHCTLLCPLPPETSAWPYRGSSLLWVPQTHAEACMCCLGSQQWTASQSLL